MRNRWHGWSCFWPQVPRIRIKKIEHVEPATPQNALIVGQKDLISTSHFQWYYIVVFVLGTPEMSLRQPQSSETWEGRLITWDRPHECVISFMFYLTETPHAPHQVGEPH